MAVSVEAAGLGSARLPVTGGFVSTAPRKGHWFYGVEVLCDIPLYDKEAVADAIVRAVDDYTVFAPRAAKRNARQLARLLKALPRILDELQALWAVPRGPSRRTLMVCTEYERRGGGLSPMHRLCLGLTTEKRGDTVYLVRVVLGKVPIQTLQSYAHVSSA